MRSAVDRHRKNQCSYKIRYTTLDAAQERADQMLEERIYDRMKPGAYQCEYGEHFHVGHSLRTEFYGTN